MYKDFKHIIHIVNKFIFNEKAIQFSIRQTLNAFAQNLRKTGRRQTRFTVFRSHIVVHKCGLVDINNK